MGTKILVDIEGLRRLYEVEHLMHSEVVARLGVSQETLIRRCREHGITCRKRGARPGATHHAWKEGRKVTTQGYVVLRRPGHPMAQKNGYVLEHRLVMAESLGRMLDPKEVVHHLNGDKQDNRAENLALLANNGLHIRLERQLSPIPPEQLQKMVAESKRTRRMKKQSGIPGLTPEGRKKISEASKKRWQEFRERKSIQKAQEQDGHQTR